MPNLASVDHPRANSISVIVPAWNWERREDLERCLGAIERQTLPPLETIVVIDHNAELLEWAQQAFPGVQAIPNRYKRGVVGARNTGAEAAQGSLVVLTDDDTEAAPDWLERLVERFDDQNVVGVTGELIPNWEGPVPAWYPPEFYWVFGCSYTGLPTEIAPVRNPIAANMAVRRQNLEQVGGFRQGAAPRQIKYRGVVLAGGHALEDTDLGIRVGQRWPDMQWLYHPGASVRHSVSPEQATLGYLVRRCFEEGATKAQLAQNVGAENGLSAERIYLSVVLPRGVLNGLRASLRGDGQGFLRAAAIAIGVLSSGAGFLVGTIMRAKDGRR
jgi:hypothetical protein